jgi:hypothetical protein
VDAAFEKSLEIGLSARKDQAIGAKVIIGPSTPPGVILVTNEEFDRQNEEWL